jgi:hypothetical protein
MLEYTLLVTLVAMVSVGALLYLGRSAASTPSVSNEVAVGVSGGGGTSPGPPGSAWCTSGTPGCSDTITINGQQTIHFWASGGLTPYTAATITGAPSLVTLTAFDAVSGTGEVTVQPTSCSQVGSYNVAIVVTDSATPPGNGRLSFSLTVADGSC